MKNFKKQCKIGKTEHFIWVTIEFSYGLLSITGVESPWRNGNCRGSCGQISDCINPLEFTKFYSGWNAVKVAKLINIWNEWHLNTTRAGSPNQRLILSSIRSDIKRDYNSDCEALKKAGIYDDPDHLVDGKPYRYGTGWISSEVPDEVVKWLYDLPAAAEEHPWGSKG